MDETPTNSEASDSPPRQRCKPTSRYKGVVPQANGNWGAQIYANHQRIWLGTFKTEDMAGAAYDSAAIQLRHGNSSDPHRNFPLNELTVHEPAFQSKYTSDQVLNMIKDGSYQTKFYEYLSISQVNGLHSDPCSSTQSNKKEGYFCRELFRKELTPSDVGKLNRLVIPKRYALKYFDPEELLRSGLQSRGDEKGGDFELTFYDKLRRSWKFRYCYWQSSSSYVFTRGWNSFVREKNLKSRDIVAFYICEIREKDENGDDVVKKFYMIDVVGFNASDVNEEISLTMPKLEDDVNDEISLTKTKLEDDHNDELRAKKGKLEEEIVENEVKGIRLFGVELFPQNSVSDI
ncbi:hypothetical protein RND81_08G114100 [Saponaria officinalis]|uniref:Uncharacterized protein n=1 Tax=Saponaria officinalis TaxID=3572 RepID=A0AAW1J679_SAPOF